jgi:hypothetical protein
MNIDNQTLLLDSFPEKFNLFGDTSIEKVQATEKNFQANYTLSIKFTGSLQGEIKTYFDLNPDRLPPSDRSKAEAILIEMSNILAGMSISQFSDKIHGSLMLIPPKMNKTKKEIKDTGIDYKIQLLNGHCKCRVILL